MGVMSSIGPPSPRSGRTNSLFPSMLLRGNKARGCRWCGVWADLLVSGRREFPQCRPKTQSRHAKAGYSITWSARTSIAVGIVWPKAFAVLRFTNSSNLVGCSTGICEGFAPFRILSTIAAARR